MLFCQKKNTKIQAALVARGDKGKTKTGQESEKQKTVGKTHSQGENTENTEQSSSFQDLVESGPGKIKTDRRENPR